MVLKVRELPVRSNSGGYSARQSAEFLLQAIERDPEADFLVPYFVAALCAGIEAALNTAYVDHFHKHLGKAYRKYAKPYLMLRLEERLIQLPFLVSGFKYVLNEKDPRVKQVLRLFDLRNQMLHVKHLWHYADITEDERGTIIDIRFADRHDSDPYRLDKKPVDLCELREHMKLHKVFVAQFLNLGSRMTRKNFKSREWFVPVTKKRAKST
jgi:hypothetical protein